MPEKTTSRVSRANRNPPTAEIPQISPASKVVNALRAKVDQTKRTPPLSKAKDSHVGFLSRSLFLWQMLNCFVTCIFVPLLDKYSHVVEKDERLEQYWRKRQILTALSDVVMWSFRTLLLTRQRQDGGLTSFHQHPPGVKIVLKRKQW